MTTTTTYTSMTTTTPTITAVSAPITEATIADYVMYLARLEKTPNTIENYERYVRRLVRFLDGRPLTVDLAIIWKQDLSQSPLSSSTINLCISAANSFFRFLGREDCLLKRLRVQPKPYRDASRDLRKDDFSRLVNAAKHAGRKREALLLETLGGTGIRVSELRYITVEAARAGRAEISLKGKVRTILIPAAVRKNLLFYAREHAISSGPIFLTAAGTPMDRRRVWAALKALSPLAGVARTKVFPHNLRHLFAVTFYSAYRDIAALADILGHSSTNTTRIYLRTTGEEHVRRLDALGLVA